MPRLMGLETEYALVGYGRRGGRASLEGALGSLLGAAQKLPHLPDFVSGMFLANGARLYPDTGGHPEYSTPECSSPSELVRHILAGEQILSALARTAQTRALPDLRIYRVNVDYGGSATWGCHESYRLSCPPKVIAEQIIPHLVTRTLYTGAGGWNPRSAAPEFVLSPRAFYLRSATSWNSTGDRGIFHEKDEPLARTGNHRLHLLCGESLCSQRATWLKVGATALVVALAEAGCRPGSAVQLQSPPKALRRLVRDPQRRLRVSTAVQPQTALEIQQHYLGMAEARLNEPWMPPWAAEVCSAWRRILELLATGDAGRTLDWAIKRHLFGRHLAHRGLSWAELQVWGTVLRAISATLRRRNVPEPLSADLLLRRDSPVRDRLSALAPRLDARGLRWEDVGRVLTLRNELCELDVKFGQLGPEGLFNALDAAGVLDHRVVEPADVERATGEPPAGTRASVRGACVRRLAGTNGVYCDWDTICDGPQHRRLDLSDPFAATETWVTSATLERDLAGLPAWLQARVRRRTAPAPDEAGPPPGTR